MTLAILSILAYLGIAGFWFPRLIRWSREDWRAENLPVDAEEMRFFAMWSLTWSLLWPMGVPLTWLVTSGGRCEFPNLDNWLERFKP